MGMVTEFPLRASAITPSDATYIPATTIYVGVTGNVAVEPAAGGNTVTFVAVPAGTCLPVRVVRVLSTGTTATSLIGIA